MKARQQLIFSLEHCSDAESERICDRLQQCTVRVIRTNGETERNTTIRTHLQLAGALRDDPSIESVEYNFNGKWTKIGD